nr:60S ribosomal protein L34 [Tanacetum cinerariifolium]
MFPVKGILFFVPGKELSNGLIQIKNDLDLVNCIAIGYTNEKVIDMFLEHHGYDLSQWIQTDIDNNDDEISDVEMEDIIGYAVSDFAGEDDVVIPNRSINDPFLNKLCNGSYINNFSDKPDVGESSQPCGKELEIDSDDEDVGKQRNDYRSLFVLRGRDLAEGRSGGKKGKKGDWPYKKENDEDELPKKDKGKQLLDTNPSSSLHLHVDEKDGKIYFKRIYICFKAPERKKVGSNFVFQTCDKDGGDADPSSAGPSVVDPSSAGPSVADPSSACPSVAGTSAAGPSVADSSSAGPSVADSTGSGTQTITEDPIVADSTDDIPTQQSKTSDTAKIIKDAIETGRLKTTGLKRRCKSERIAKRAKAFQFGKDGAGSYPDKAWDVDDVLAEK